VAKIEGLSGAMLNEMLDFGDGIGRPGAEPGKRRKSAPSSWANTPPSRKGRRFAPTGKLLQVPVGKALWAA